MLGPWTKKNLFSHVLFLYFVQTNKTSQHVIFVSFSDFYVALKCSELIKHLGLTLGYPKMIMMLTLIVFLLLPIFTSIPS